MSNIQYMHVFEVSVRLGKGTYAVMPVYVFSYDKELPAQCHTVSSCDTLESMAKAYLHCKHANGTQPLELIDHTKGCKVLAEVNKLLEEENRK